MAFNYDEALSADRDKVRFSIGDTVENAGPKPSDGNFSDAEIAGLLVLEGTWQRATAAAFEALAAIWARFPQSYNVEGVSNNWDAAREFRAQAQSWRDKYGFGESSTVVSRPVTRTDAYSNDLDAVESSNL